jgi:hypothetical protein
MLRHLILSHKEVYRSRYLMLLLLRYMLIGYMPIRYMLYKRQLSDTYDMARILAGARYLLFFGCPSETYTQ